MVIAMNVRAWNGSAVCCAMADAWTAAAPSEAVAAMTRTIWPSATGASARIVGVSRIGCPSSVVAMCLPMACGLRHQRDETDFTAWATPGSLAGRDRRQRRRLIRGDRVGHALGARGEHEDRAAHRTFHPHERLLARDELLDVRDACF